MQSPCGQEPSQLLGVFGILPDVNIEIDLLSDLQLRGDLLQ